MAALIVALNLRTLGQRRGSALSTIVGVACVVAVFVVVLSIGEGFRATMAATGAPDSALVLRGGSDSEMMSGLLADATRIIADAPGVGPHGDGAAVPRPSCSWSSTCPSARPGPTPTSPCAACSRPPSRYASSFKIIQGRLFEPGTNEIIVGRGAAEQFAGLDLGRHPALGREPVDRRRHLHRRRQPVRVGDLVRCPASSSRPTGAAAPSSRCMPCCSPPRRSPPSRTPSPPIRGWTSRWSGRASTTPSSPRA